MASELRRAGNRKISFEDSNMFFKEYKVSNGRCEVMADSESKSGFDLADMPEHDAIRCSRPAKFCGYTDTELWDDGVALCAEHFDIWFKCEESHR
jgi:hypothetical protein